MVLAWGCTVHKVQGMSLDCAVLDVGSNVFEKGMAYVALSRIRSLSGLYLIRLDLTKSAANECVIDENKRLKTIIKRRK